MSELKSRWDLDGQTTVKTSKTEPDQSLTVVYQAVIPIERLHNETITDTFPSLIRHLGSD